MKISLLSIFLLILPYCYGYSMADVDSIKNVIETTDDDSLKIEAFYELARQTRKTDVNLAIEYCEKSASIARETNAYGQLADALNYIGILYYGIGNYEQTLHYFYQVLSIYEKNQDSVKLGRVYNNVGLILTELGRIEETIEYYDKSLKMKIAFKDSLGLSSTYSNLGLAYDQLGQNDKALEYYRISLKLDEKHNDYNGLFVDMSNIGENYMSRDNYDSAAHYFEKAMSLFNQVDDPYHKAELLEQFARLNRAQGKYSRAIEKHNNSISFAESIEAKSVIANNYNGLSKVYKALGQLDKSLEYYEKYVALHEELFNEEQSQKLKQIESNYQIQSRENKITLLNKEAQIKDLNLAQNQMLIYFMAGVIVLIMFIIFLQYKKNAYKTKTYSLLRAQNEEIVEKNKNIMDSILCAKNIQQAILPDDQKLKGVFSESFVMSKARDVVSGDFYWFAERDDKVLIAAVDCTGHGVPAAFLNVMGNSLLNQIVHESNVLSPSEVLAELNSRVLKSLKAKDIYVQVDDGMDIGICQFERKSKRLSFAGAKRPMYYFHQDKLEIIKGDHFPVGGNLYENNRVYSEHTLQLEENDLIYLFTDGIVDQFGGDKNKKFMYRRLKELLKGTIEMPLDQQKLAIEKTILEWQGNNEQTDDMLLIGIKV
ncbi:MAG TPA: tetratricopeptide repeat protein [Fulvivirga sp.]|nr:tetratricopeptide repeat protein [Fulvivirga sp.]